MQHGSSYELEGSGNDIACREVNVPGYEEQLATAIYAPGPVSLTRTCAEIDILNSEDESERGWSCLDRDFATYPAAKRPPTESRWA